MTSYIKRGVVSGNLPACLFVLVDIGIGVGHPNFPVHTRGLGFSIVIHIKFY